MEEKNEQQVMRTVSDEELQQVSGGVEIVGNDKCEKYRTQESCLSKQKCAGTLARSDALQAPCTLKGKGRGLRSSALSLIELSLSLVGAHFQKVKF